jgi:hypothetical protein
MHINLIHQSQFHQRKITFIICYLLKKILIKKFRRSFLKYRKIPVFTINSRKKKLTKIRLVINHLDPFLSNLRKKIAYLYQLRRRL